jgi:Tol biopolymer transport system component
MTTRRTLHLPALLRILGAAVLVACAVALLAVLGEAEATFPGKNGKIAYNNGGVIYTINPDGSAKTKVTNTYVSGYPIDYSPDGKKIVYYKGNDLDGKIYTINVGGGGKSKVTEGSNPAWGSRP